MDPPIDVVNASIAGGKVAMPTPEKPDSVDSEMVDGKAVGYKPPIITSDTPQMLGPPVGTA